MAGDQLLRPVGEPTRRDWIAVMSVMLGAFMAVLDIQITNSSLKDIQGALSATLEEGSWISTSYLVAEIIMIPLTAWLVQLLSALRLAVWIKQKIRQQCRATIATRLRAALGQIRPDSKYAEFSWSRKGKASLATGSWVREHVNQRPSTSAMV